MATITIYPTADGSDTGWNDEGGTYTKVNEVGAHDGDASYLYSGASGQRRSFTFGSTGLTTETINSITIQSVVKGVDPVSSIYNSYVKVGGINYDSTDIDSGGSTSYISTDKTWATNPNTSAAWTVSEVNSIIAGVRRGTGGGQRLTQIRIVVDYSAAAPNTNPAFLLNFI